MDSFGATDPTTHQLSQISAILNSDYTSQFEALISDLMSPANDERSKAQKLFHLGKQHHPNALVLKLCQLLPVSSKRAMCAVLLRVILTVDSSSGEDGIYTHLSGNTQSALHRTLIECVGNETNKSVLKKVCDIVSELAATVLPGYGWYSFFGYMFKWVASDIDRHRESALLIFAQLVQYSGGLLVPHLVRLHQAFLECLGSGMVADVRIAAFTASINFIRYLEEASDRDKFHDLIPLMMQTFNDALVWNESTSRESMLKLLIEWAGTETFVYEGVAEAMLQTAEDENLEEVTKHLALEFVVTLVEARETAPGMINELPQLVKRLFEVLMKMLSDVEDDPDWYSAEIEHEDAGETNNYIVGQEYLDRLSISLGGNTIVPVIFEIFAAYLAAPEWQKHHAAIIAIAQIAEGCSKVMTKNLEQVVSMILNSFKDPHPRARWAAINAIGQLSTNLGPDLQNHYHHLVLPALASAMDDFHNIPRMQVHATSMVLIFSKNCPPRVLQPYLDGIVGKLLVLLQNTNHMVQEGALTALASVGGSSQVHFENYYDAVMPYLRDILVNANDKANHMLCAKSMKCICLVGMAVEFDKFKDDVKLVIEVLQGSQLETNDPTISLLLQYIGELLVQHLEKSHQEFLEGLHSTGMVADVRIAAFTASINFIRYLEKASDMDKFRDLIPLMMQTMNEALVWNESTALESTLKLLIELAGTETFVYESIVEVVEAMLQIAEAENLEEGTKHLALEFVVTLAEARERAPRMITKLPLFVKRLFEVLLKMLLDVEDDPDWHRAEIEHEDAGETSNYSAGKEFLYRLSISLGGNTIVPVIFKIFRAYLAAPEWQKHHAALIALAQMAKGCSKFMTRNGLERVVSMILKSFKDPHPRARWAAINAIGQLSTDLGPDFQNRCYHLVLRALASAMDDFHNPRLQAHAASAVLNFSENCTPELLQPHLYGIVGKLLVLLQNSNQMVQEGALTALALVGGSSSRDHFRNYYGAVMPYLRDILVNANNNANRMLCAKSMKCICLVGMAVGFYKFKDDVKLVMDVLHGSQLETNDLTIRLLWQSWEGYQEYRGDDHYKFPEQAAFLLYLYYFMQSFFKYAPGNRFMRWKTDIILAHPGALIDVIGIEKYILRTLRC